MNLRHGSDWRWIEPLFTPPEKTQIEADVVDDELDLTSLDALFATTHVDKARLMQTIRRRYSPAAKYRWRN